MRGRSRSMSAGSGYAVLKVHKALLRYADQGTGGLHAGEDILDDGTALVNDEFR